MERPNGDAAEPVNVNATDVDAAHAEAVRAKAELDDAERRRMAIVERHRRMTRRLMRWELIRRARRLCDNYTTRQGGLFILIFGACLIIMVVSHALGLPFFLWAILFLAAFTTASFAGTLLFTPSDAQLAEDVDALNKEAGSVVIQRAQAATRVSEAKNRFQQCLLTYQGAFGHFQTRLDRLRSTNWQSLAAVPFAEFVAEVLGAHGYEVSRGTATGDKAVDLIACKTGYRALIHVRVAPNWTVGADAVDQTRTSETVHACDGCAVITNSTFAPGARRAAKAAECVLVDREEFPLLIEGKVKV
jgi:HJR/Mrr/RecB family endonuclease